LFSGSLALLLAISIRFNGESTCTCHVLIHYSKCCYNVRSIMRICKCQAL
jgi:hypothetical protein